MTKKILFCFIFALLFASAHTHSAFSQSGEGGKAKVFETQMRAIDAASMFAGKAKVKIWGVKQLDNLPVLIAERGRVALDNAIGKEAVQCELKQRYEDYLLAQCVNSLDQDLGLLMLQAGYVSVDRGVIYNSVFEEPYLQAEDEAQAKEVGIWVDDEAQSGGSMGGSRLLVFAVVLFVVILAAFGVLSIIIMRGFEKVIDAQNRNIDMLGRERRLKNKERAVVASMLDSEIKANKSKIEAYLVVYEEMLADIQNPQRQPKYKKAGDILQSQPALDRSVFDRNTDKLDILGDQLSSEVIHFYARIKTKPDYINLEPDMPLEEATALVEKGIHNARRMNKVADCLIDSFDDSGLSSEHFEDED